MKMHDKHKLSPYYNDNDDDNNGQKWLTRLKQKVHCGLMTLMTRFVNELIPKINSNDWWSSQWYANNAKQQQQKIKTKQIV